MNIETPEKNPAATTSVTLASKKKSLLASSVGNILEWYEWSAYAVFAPFIAAAMFNSDNPVSALLSTLAVFAVGFLMRPLGGIVFGRIADKRGRKFVLVTTMLMMAACATSTSSRATTSRPTARVRRRAGEATT